MAGETIIFFDLSHMMFRLFRIVLPTHKTLIMGSKCASQLSMQANIMSGTSYEVSRHLYYQYEKQLTVGRIDF